MKQRKAKRRGQRALALALAWVLLGQAVPVGAVAANADWTEEIAVEAAAPVQSTVLETEETAPAEQETTDEQETLGEQETADEQETAGEQETAQPAEEQNTQEAEQEDRYEPSAAAEGYIEITGPQQLLNGIPAGSTYVLANDVVMGPDQQIDVVAGVLDGAGHTITISGKPLVRELTGTIQNLLVDGKAPLQDGEGSIVCMINGGTLQNCGSTVQIDAGWFSSFLGGLAGKVENGKIYNSYFAGTGKDAMGITVINGIFYISNNSDAPSMIKNSYYTEGNKIGSGSAWNEEDGSNGKKSLEQMKTPEFAELLNATNVGSGYVWKAEEGSLPKLVPGGGELEPCDKTALEAAIKEAQSKNESDYTNESWTSMQEALDLAKSIFQKIDATQEQANEAAEALQNALAALVEKVRDLSPVEPPKNGVIPISSKEDFARINGTDPGAFYQLTQDIVIDGNFRSPNLAGVLDGNGHTITIRIASPLFINIVETGVVQNLRVKVEGNFTNRQEFAPFAEKLKGGMIVNCISEVTGQHSTGYVRKMEDGVMVNCLTMGHNRRGAFVFFQKSTDHQNSNGYKSGKFYNCYWSASNSVENINPAENLIRCEAIGDERLRSDAFLAQLNSQKGNFGAQWGRDANGYPYFGEDQGDLVIDGSNNRYPVQFVWHDGQILDVKNGNLELSPQMTGRNRFAGTFQLKDVPSDSTITWSCEDRTHQEIMQLGENGELYVFHDGGGVVRAVEHKADGTQQLAAEIRVVSASREIKELRLVLDGNVIEEVATIQGSAVKNLEIQARYADSDEFKRMPAYLVELKSEKPELLRTDYNSAEFYFKEPGTSKLTVTEKTNKENPVSVTVSITSAYVPVESVKPAIGGTMQIHYRNSMGAGQFISFPQTVFVEPSNASYKSNVSVESSDPSIAEYDGSGYIPYKNGAVTFTAKINDNGKVVEGKSQVTFVYTNPLTEVTASEKKITLNQGAKQSLPLIFHGQPGNPHEITEPNLIWTFDKKGIVSIQRPDALMQIRDAGSPDNGNWVASTKFEVRGLRPGTVVATGTPVDTTGNAKPVKITITVKGDGSAVQEFDIPKFIETGKKTASSYLKANNTFTFGEEWNIYTLLRDGQSLPQHQLDSYYDDVVTNARSWKPNVLATEVERTAIALNIMGKDITDVGGVNFVELICNHPNLTKQGSNALAWALIALDMNNTKLPADVQWTRERMVAELLTYQNRDGGFGLDKSGTSDIDMTAMSIQALARYRNESEVAAAIEKGIGYLAAAAENNLNFGNSESIAQVVIALAVLNRDIVEEPGFGDEMENILSVLSEYMVEGEGFKHSKNGAVDKMATAQAMQALCAYERFLNGESSYWDLLGTGPMEGPAEKVSSMIAALPENITLKDAYAVKMAREAYDRLTAEQKAQVKNLNKLEAAEAALKELASVDSVIDMINALPENITLMDETAVQAVRAAYNLLTEAQQAQVKNVQKLLKAEKSIEDQKAAAKVEKMIDALPEPLGIGDKQAAQTARSAYEALSAEQKALVKNLSKLIQAEEEIKDLDAAQKVMGIIKDLPVDITAADEQAIQAARSAYQALTEKQQKLVLNLYILERAEQIVAEKKAVQAVEDAINALPETITQNDQDTIKAARAAYNQLAPELKKLVRNLDKLTKAEKALKALRKPAGKLNGSYGTDSNVVEAVVENGMVSAKQLADIQGKDLILRIEGTMESGEAYVLSLYGKDIVKAEDFNIEMKRKGLYEEEIHKLSEEPEIFRFLETGAFPGPIMVQMDTALADGEYLLLHYDPVQQRASLVTRVQVEDGTVQFIVQEGGEYFLAKKASKKSIPELEQAKEEAEELQVENQDAAKETMAATGQTQPVQQEQKSNSVAWIWIPLLLVSVGCVIGVIIVLKKKKEHKGE